jgi:hypothetical protein
VVDGKDTPFWEAIWLNGVSPKQLVLTSTYKCVTNLEQYTELHNPNLIQNIKQLNIKVLMDEFILLFTTLNDDLT